MKLCCLIVSLSLHAIFFIFLDFQFYENLAPGNIRRRRKRTISINAVLKNKTESNRSLRSREYLKSKQGIKLDKQKNRRSPLDKNDSFFFKSNSQKTKRHLAEEHLNLLTERGSGIGGKYIHPRYPRLSRIYGEEGKVKIRIIVNKGKMIEARVVQSSGYERLDLASLKAISSWEFPNGFTRMFIQQISFEID